MIEISQQVAPLCLIVGIPFSPQPDSSINSRNQIDSFIIHAKNSSDISTNMAESLQDLNFRLGTQFLLLLITKWILTCFHIL